MSNDDTAFNSVVEPTAKTQKSEKQWRHNLRHGGYFIVVFIWRFIFGPKNAKPPKARDSQFKFIAEQLISTLPDNENGFITSTTQKLLEQHRTIENTQARRRLEKWACWTIILYLSSVFVLVVLNGFSRVIWPDIFKDRDFISETVMYVILSTTTINIIGLGIIVLKGHFPHEDKDKSSNPS